MISECACRNTGSVEVTYARPSAQAAQAFQVFSSNRRGTNDGGTIAATRSRSQAPRNGVVPSAAAIRHHARRGRRREVEQVPR